MPLCDAMDSTPNEKTSEQSGHQDSRWRLPPIESKRAATLSRWDRIVIATVFST